MKDKIKNNFILEIIFENRENKFIKRKKEDLKWLKDYLKIEFPYLFIPPLISENFEKNYIEIFFKKIFNKDFIQESEILKIFINDKKFSKIKNKKINLKEEKILNKMNLLFIDENKKKEINENEMFYDSFFNTVLGNYIEKKQDLNYFKNLFEKMEINFSKEQDHFYDIKSLFSQLNGFLTNSEDIIKKIVFTLKTFSENHDDFFKKINFQKNENFKNIQENIINGLNSWSDHFKKTKKSIKNNLTFFFHFKEKESSQFSNLLKNRVINLTESIGRLDEISNKKKEIFQIKDYSKWQINKNINVKKILEICENYEKVEKIMLTDETFLENEIKRKNLFINKRILYQYFDFYNSTPFYFEDNLRNFSYEFKNSFYDKNNLWNLFEKSNTTFLSKLINPIF